MVVVAGWAWLVAGIRVVACGGNGGRTRVTWFLLGTGCLQWPKEDARSTWRDGSVHQSRPTCLVALHLPEWWQVYRSSSLAIHSIIECMCVSEFLLVDLSSDSNCLSYQGVFVAPLFLYHHSCSSPSFHSYTIFGDVRQNLVFVCAKLYIILGDVRQKSLFSVCQI
jgi:hypothetical protein